MPFSFYLSALFCWEISSHIASNTSHTLNWFAFVSYVYEHTSSYIQIIMFNICIIIIIIISVMIIIMLISLEFRIVVGRSGSRCDL